jgi:hypothetical protein
MKILNLLLMVLVVKNKLIYYKYKNYLISIQIYNIIISL